MSPLHARVPLVDLVERYAEPGVVVRRRRVVQVSPPARLCEQRRREDQDNNEDLHLNRSLWLKRMRKDALLREAHSVCGRGLHSYELLIAPVSGKLL